MGWDAPALVVSCPRMIRLYVCRCHAYQSQPGQGPTLTQEDVVLLAEELERGKSALAEVQALRLEVKEVARRDQDGGEGRGREDRGEGNRRLLMP